MIRIEIGLIDSICPKTGKVIKFLADNKALYFDGSQTTELEEKINTLPDGYHREQKSYLKTKSSIIRQKRTKFNFKNTSNSVLPKSNDIIIFGQCVGDMAIEATVTVCKTNIELIEQVMSEYGDNGDNGRIFYKSHPKNWCNVSDMAYIAEKFPQIIIIDEKQNPIELLENRPTCIVNTSGLGFEALIRDCPVTCYGISFYSNWGFTTDKIACDRRVNRPDFDDFAAFFLLEYTKSVSE